MEALHSPEKSLAIFQSTWRNILEDLNFQQYRCKKLKSGNIDLFWHVHPTPIVTFIVGIYKNKQDLKFHLGKSLLIISYNYVQFIKFTKYFKN